MLYKSPTAAMSGGDNKLSFSVESILKDRHTSRNEAKSSSKSAFSHDAANEVRPVARSHQIMRNKLTRRHYSTSSIESVGLGSGYYPSSILRASSSASATGSDNSIEYHSLDAYNTSPSPLSSPRSVASLPQECLQGNNL